MINESLYKNIERNVISKINRFEINKEDLRELKKTFRGKTILISGASGSIGSQFSKDIFKYELKLKKIIFLDKDENTLTELNRELLVLKNFKKVEKEFICVDLNSTDIGDLLNKENVEFYLNFAAIKHVRSEENVHSIKYMFKTNSINFAPKKKHKLKKIFSISTDKTVNPSSILGVSKNLMEIHLSKFKSKDTFVSSVRFANVSFSNGSILKYVVDRIRQKKEFGVPENIKRFFITHSEASSLCFKSLLIRNNNKIIIPNPRILNKDFLIKDLTERIILNFKLNPKFYKNKNKILTNNYKNKQCYVLLTSVSDGQKTYEELFSENENIINDSDNTVCKVNLPPYNKRTLSLLNKILICKSINQIKTIILREFDNYNPPIKTIKLSKTI